MKNFKRFISTMLVACMAVSMTSGAVGTVPETGAHENENHNAILMDATNNEYIVAGVLVDTKAVSRNGQEGYSQTYAYTVDFARASGSQGSNGSDSKNSVVVYSTVYYLTKDSPKEYLVTTVEGSWRILDGVTSVTNCSVKYACNGVNVSDQLGNVSSIGNNFMLATGFNRYATTFFGAAGASMTLSLFNGGNAWTFTLQNNLPAIEF